MDFILFALCRVAGRRYQIYQDGRHKKKTAWGLAGTVAAKAML
jgi:hypothetical protein